MKRIAAVSLLGLALALPALADDRHHKDKAGAAAPAGTGVALAEGEVRRVDKDAKKITIKHGPLPRLDMPPMTMVFQVRDPAMLEQVKPGDRILFDADKIGGAYTVLKIEPAK